MISSRARRGRRGRRRASTLTAIPTAQHAPHVAHVADEAAAVGTRISLRRALFLGTRPTHHGVSFAHFGHLVPVGSARSYRVRDVSPYSLIFLISVAREIPSSRAACVRFALCARNVRSM